MEGVPVKILGRVTSNFSYKHDGTKFVREFSISCDPLALIVDISLVSFSEHVSYHKIQSSKY